MKNPTTATKVVEVCCVVNGLLGDFLTTTSEGCHRQLAAEVDKVVGVTVR